MNKMTSAELRQAFLDYFHEINHEVVASSPLPNYDNPTLLFTNAGMNQFADVFLGKESRAYKRAATSQKVMRVQGKHNDLENVGPSHRHHTFFEMLGNFSFGDYFKAEAIDFGFNFLTKVVGLEAERLYATVYNGLKEGKPYMDADAEAAKLWERYLPPERIRGYDYEDNYWVMGETGPNGPCSELHYYLGDLDNVNVELLNSDDDVDEQFLEVWNLVFMQYGTDENGVTTPLPAPSIDTGMSLERLARIVQSADSNYETDLFSPVMDKVQQLLGDNDEERIAHNVGYRVIADHGRAATFLIGDGVIPGNTGAPYVLRMIIRRAARFGRKIGFTQPFLAEIAQVYINEMGAAYPEIRAKADFIKHTIIQEEKRFARTLDRALQHFDAIIDQLNAAGATVIPGNTAFDLKATHGLPIEITRDLGKERGYSVDEAGYEAAKEAHAIASGTGAFGKYDASEQIYADSLDQLIANGTLERTGVDYDPYSGANGNAPIVGIFCDGEIITEAETGFTVEVVTTSTPFYIEAGGEVSDTGTISTDNGTIRVTDMANKGGLIVHVGRVESGTITVGEMASLAVDDVRRANIRRNHTATHILHQELRDKLGTHVTQQGSLVAPDRLRFDFSHGDALSDAELAEIEAKINDAILANYGVSAEYMPKDDAINLGAMALFGEKYGDIVRTVQIDERGAYSLELCGGLHVANTGEIGAFHFTSEGSVSAGVRRVEAVTGKAANEYVASKLNLLSQLSKQLNSNPNDLVQRVDALLQENKRLQKTVEQLQRGQAKVQFESLFGTMQSVSGTNLLVGQVDGVDADGLREMTDWFNNRVDSGVVVLATVRENGQTTRSARPIFIASVSKDLIKRGVKAGDIVRQMGEMTGGGGGGRPNLAQAGGRDASKVGDALASVPALVESKLA